MILVKIYIVFNLIIFLPNEEWNAQNPRPFPKNEYVLMNWEKADFQEFARRRDEGVVFDDLRAVFLTLFR